MTMTSRITALVLVALMVVSTLVVAPASAGDGDGTRWGPGFDASQDYIVVAPEGWRTTLQPLLDWRERTSIYEIIFLSLEEANANGEGHDRAARLKDSIRDVSPDASYNRAILLVGDSEIIPVRWVFTDILQDGNLTDPLNFRWTDDYYNYGVESDWDKDGDRVYGEDGEVLDELVRAFYKIYPEAGGPNVRQMGRIPASNVLEVERFVNKLLEYERSPPPGDWFNSALFISGLMDVPNYLDDPFTPDIDGGYELFSDNSYESHTKLADLLPDTYETTWLWDYPFIEGGYWNRSVDTLDHDSAVAAFDQGHSILAMNGHGWIDGTGLAHYNGSGSSNYWWDWHNAYDYTDADNASNGGKLPWAYVAACYVGDVTLAGDRSLERWVMNPDGGVIGLVAGNGENYKGESMANASFGNWFLERTFWSNYFKVGPGLAMHYTKQAYLKLVSSDEVPHPPLYDAYYIADYLSPNLLGDPLTKVWTDQPGELQVVAIEDLPRSSLDDRILLRVTDGDGNPVKDAWVHIIWEGGSYESHTNEDGWMGGTVPLDAGELDIVVAAKNHLPLELKADRPVEFPDIKVTEISWNNGSSHGYANNPPLEGEEVSLRAEIETDGRYESGQMRVRFSVAPEAGAFERLVPDVFIGLRTDGVLAAFHDWTPPQAGKWTVRVDADPEGEHPDAIASNNVRETTLWVRGPPVWTYLPDEVSMDCGGAPGDHIDLLKYVVDPDTPLGELEFSAEQLGEPVEGVSVHVGADGRLIVCSDLALVTVTIGLTVSDGTYEDTGAMIVTIDRGVSRMRLVGDTYHLLDQATTVAGEIQVENLGPGPAVDVELIEIGDHPDFVLLEDGEFTFTGRLPGVHLVSLGLQRANGTTEEIWQGITIMFQVEPNVGEAPYPNGWVDLHVVEDQKAEYQLQALDLEGGVVTYSILSDDGLGATVDPVTGLLTLRPAEGDLGEHEVIITLSDGTMDDTAILMVYVTEGPSGSQIWGIAIAVACLIAISLLVLFLWSRHRDGDDDGDGD